MQRSHSQSAFPEALTIAAKTLRDGRNGHAGKRRRIAAKPLTGKAYWFHPRRRGQRCCNAGIGGCGVLPFGVIVLISS
jgi:hypothetical protein